MAANQGFWFLTVILYSPGIKLSGSKASPALNSARKVSKHHVMVYTAQAILDHPEIRLSQAGMILIALLAGGDYDKVRVLDQRENRHGINLIFRASKSAGRISHTRWHAVASENSSWLSFKGACKTIFDRF